MNVFVRSYLIAGAAVASTGFFAVAPAVLPVTPYGSWVASAQPTDDTHRPGPGTGSGSPGDATPSVAGQATPGSRPQTNVVSGDGQASSSDSGRVAVRLPSRATATVGGNTAAARTTSDVQSFGASGNRVTVAANGFIRPHTQSTTTRSATTASATAASAPDSASAPSTGRTINAAVQRALAGHESATAHAGGGAGTTTATGQAPTGIPAAQPARSSSPYAGNR